MNVLKIISLGSDTSYTKTALRRHATMPHYDELNVTTSSGCDVDDLFLDTSVEDFGSPPPPLQPRKLSFNNMDCNNSPECDLRVNDNSILPTNVTGESSHFLRAFVHKFSYL